jgi:hypothetical protein
MVDCKPSTLAANQQLQVVDVDADNNIVFVRILPHQLA